MPLSEEERRERNRIASAQYRARKKARAAKNDPKAINQLKKDNRNRLFSSAKSFIRNHATKAQISELRDVMAERINRLNKK